MEGEKAMLPKEATNMLRNWLKSSPCPQPKLETKAALMDDADKLRKFNKLKATLFWQDVPYRYPAKLEPASCSMNNLPIR